MDYKMIINSNDKNKQDYLDNEEFPKSIAVETTNYCNLSCSYCGYSKMTREKGYMKTNIYKKIIDEIAKEDKNTTVWLEAYGEPLLLGYKLSYYIRYAKDRGLKNVFISTNGLLLDEEISEAILYSGIDRIIISLDAFYNDTYLKIRNNNKFDEVKNNIKNLILMRKKLNSNAKIEVQLIKIPNIHKEDEIENFQLYWQSKGADVRVKNFITWNGAVSAANDSKKDRYPCGWLFRTMAITWDGNVGQCSCDYNGRYVVGNIIKNSIKEIWQGNLKKIRDLHLVEQYYNTPICEKCSDWESYYLMPFLQN